jgi:hypothetical protein
MTQDPFTIKRWYIRNKCQVTFCSTVQVLPFSFMIANQEGLASYSSTVTGNVDAVAESIAVLKVTNPFQFSGISGGRLGVVFSSLLYCALAYCDVLVPCGPALGATYCNCYIKR